MIMNFGSLIPWQEKRQAPTRREDYLDPFAAFRREMDRVFDDFFRDFARPALRPANGNRDAMTPLVDVAETEKEVVVTAELPGLDEKDFEVTLAGDVLTIKGEKKVEREEKDGDAYYVERQFGSFSRSLRLPFEAGDATVEAKFDRGLLTVRIPKPVELRSAVRKIDVKAV
jgi:HSP20 family protein